MAKKISEFIYKKKKEAGKPEQTIILATYSQLLALEPRLVFDAAAVATVDAMIEHKNETSPNAEKEGTGSAPETSVSALDGQKSLESGADDLLNSLSNWTENSPKQLPDEATNTLITALEPGQKTEEELVTGLDSDGLEISASEPQKADDSLVSDITLESNVDLKPQEASSPNSSEILANSPPTPEAVLFGPPVRAPFGASWSEAPTISFDDGNFTVDEDDILIIDPAAPNTHGILLGDNDSEDFEVILNVTNGSLELSMVPGVVDNTFTYNADRTQVSFRASKDVAQKVLDSLKYRPSLNFNTEMGAAVLTVTLSELVNGEYGYNVDQIFTKNITVNPKADKPIFKNTETLPEAAQVVEDVPTVLKFNHGTSDSPDLRPLEIADPDGSTDRYDLSITVTKGSLNLPGDGPIYTLANKTLAEINSILAGLTFTGEKDFYGTATLNLSLSDLNGELMDNELNKTFNIDVLAENDAPSFIPAPIGENDPGEDLYLYVDELRQAGDGSTLGPAEGILDLQHFNKDWAPIPITSPNQIVPEFDVDNSLQQVVIKISEQSQKGTMWRKIGSDWVKLGVGSTFSLWDVSQGMVKYVHEQSLQVREEISPNSTTDSFTYVVNDGAGSDDITGKVNIVLKPVNQPPKVVVGPIVNGQGNTVVPSGRLDSYWDVDPVTNGPVQKFTIWAYEGEQGIAVAFDVLDPDQAPGVDYKVVFDVLPPADLGYFWYDPTGTGDFYAKVVAGTELSLEHIQNGFLRFNHSGKENGGSVNFTIKVIDDGGGLGDSGTKTISQNMSLNIRPNNDDPEWTGVGDIWDDAQHTVHGAPGDRVIVLTNDFLKLTDNDSHIPGLSYTIRALDGENGATGQLLFDNGDGTYRKIGVNDKITQAEIDSGKVVWRFNGAGTDLTVNISFIVRDGSITSHPTPNDTENHSLGEGLPYPPHDGQTATNWQHGQGPREGGIGRWTNTGEWIATEHTLTLVAHDVTGIDPDPIDMIIDPVPQCGGTITREVVEGQLINFRNDNNTPLNPNDDYSLIEAWFTDGENGSTLDPNSFIYADPANLTYRVEAEPSHGYILFYDGATYQVIGLHGSFTQADIDAGKIFYLHNGSENFTDNFNFTVSDGRQEAQTAESSSGNKKYLFTQEFDIIPRNDSPIPRQGSTLDVMEHDLAQGETAGQDSPGGKATITLDHINVNDVDGQGGKSGQTDYSTINDWCVVITKLPEFGKLLYNQGTEALPDWVEVSVVPNGDVGSLKAGTGWKDWGPTGFTVITKADIVAGKLLYQHSGGEQFNTDFQYLVSDNKGVAANDAVHNSWQLQGNSLTHLAGRQASVSQHGGQVKIAISAVNDKPEVPTATVVEPIKVAEGGQVIINKDYVNASLDANHIKFVDPDGGPSAIQFKITELPLYGQLKLNGNTLGVGSVFTQADVDAGLVTYEHDGSENHASSFKCVVSDSNYTSDPIGFDFSIVRQNDAPTITAPEEAYVSSIKGGIIVNIDLKDPDYNGLGAYPGSGIAPGQDMITVNLILIDPSGDASLFISKIYLRFSDGAGGFIDVGGRTGEAYTLVGTYNEIRQWLAEVKVLSGSDATEGEAYDPNGELQIAIEVYDGVYENGQWVKPNGGGGNVERAESLTRVFISPLNDRPEVSPSGPHSITLAEDSPWVPVVGGGNNPLSITDPDAFSNGGNSITLTVEHGKLSAGGKTGKTITLSGTLEQINQILAGLKYNPDSNYNGADSIRFFYTDNGNSGNIKANDMLLPSFDPKANNVFETLNSPGKLKYDTGRKDIDNNTIYGLAVYGEIRVNVTPVNDQPLINAPDELFFNQSVIFGGTDNRGESALITLTDVDTTTDIDLLTITLKLSDTDSWLEINDFHDAICGSFLERLPGQYTEITLTGTKAQLEAILSSMKYDRNGWINVTDTLTLTVKDDIGAASNGSLTNGTALSSVKVINIYCDNSNDAPTIILPGGGGLVFLEDQNENFNTIFTGSDKIIINDQDSFNERIYVRLNVTEGFLNITSADLIAAGFKLSGNPSDLDQWQISADGKSIEFLASQAKINAALEKVGYKTPANFNGEDPLNVYIHDLGLWGQDLGGSTPVEPNGFGLTEIGLESTSAKNITITKVNDAPAVTPSGNINFGSIGEDVASADNNGKKVEDLFLGRFDDSKDNQYHSTNNDIGSQSNAFIGVWVSGIESNSSHGQWTYSLNGTDWYSITTSMFLDRNTLVRFEPAANFNSESNTLGTVAPLQVRLVESKDYASASGLGTNDLSSGTTYTLGSLVHDVSEGSTNRYSELLNLNISVTAVNDAPAINGFDSGAGSSASDRLPAIEDQQISIPGLSFSDLDAHEKNNQKIEVTLNAGKGTLNVGTSGTATVRGNNTATVSIRGTINEINAIVGALKYTSDNNYNGYEQITVTISDFGNTGVGGALSATKTVYLDVASVNDAPTIAGGKENITKTIDENSSQSNSGNQWTVNDLFQDSFSDAKDALKHPSNNPTGSEADAFEGVLITGVNSTHGTWAYSLDNGVSWVTITGPTVSNALYLDKNVLISFTPTADYNNTTFNTLDLTAKLYETGAGPAPWANGTTGINTSILHDATARLTANEATVKITVNPINNAPTVIGGIPGSVQLADINEDISSATNAGQKVSDLVDHPSILSQQFFQDSKDQVVGGSTADSLAGVLIDGNSATIDQGFWQYSSDNGATWVNIPANLSGTSLALKADYLIRFAPAEHYNGIPGALKLHLIDNSANTILNPDVPIWGGAGFSSPIKGGVSRYSILHIDIQQEVKAVNDAPFDVGSGLLTLPPLSGNWTDATNGGDTVANIFNGRFGDLYDFNYGNPLEADQLAGIVVKEINTPALDGDWQYSIDNGASWLNLTADIFVKITDKIRFSPATPGFIGSIDGLSVYLAESGHPFFTYTSGDTYPAVHTNEADHDPSGQLNKVAINVGLNFKPVELPPLIPFLPPSDNKPFERLDEEGPSYSGLTLEVEKPVLNNVNNFYQDSQRKLDLSFKDLSPKGYYNKLFPSFDKDIFDELINNDDLLIGGQVGEINFIIGAKNDFQLPSDLFYYRGVGRQLMYEAAMADGSPLPAWLRFDANIMSFLGQPPEAEEEELEILLTASCIKGNKATVAVSIRLTAEAASLDLETKDSENILEPILEPSAEEEPSPEANDNTATNPREKTSPGLSVQISSYGRQGLLAAAQDFLRNIQLL